MDVTAHERIAVTVARWHRVVVEPIAHQRQRGDTRRELLAGVVRRKRQRLEGGKIALQPLPDRPMMAAQTVRHSMAAAFQQMGVQRLEALKHRDWYEEVPSRIADEPFDFALVVAFARSAEPVLEQVVRLQLGEPRVRYRLPSPRMLATAILVLSYRIDCGTPPTNANARIWPSQKAFRRLCRITGHKTGV